MQIASKLIGSCRVICLYGDLGSGKTVFAKGYAQALGIPKKDIKSPTYTYQKIYSKNDNKIYHFDFYRIEEIDDLMKHDLEDMLMERNAIFLIEWPEKIEEILPKKRTNVFFSYIDKNKREIIIEEKNEI